MDDRLTADAALRRVRRGEYLLYTGDFHNAKQLVGAMARRLPDPPQVRSPLDAFRAERRARQLEHETLSRIVVALDRDYRLQVKRAPDVAEACRRCGASPTPTRRTCPSRRCWACSGPRSGGARGWRCRGWRAGCIPTTASTCPRAPTTWSCSCPSPT
ncbi:hypothetical protein ACN28S_18525 [Cystobacter fuscus]